MTSNLAKRQAAFLGAILDDQSPLPKGWGERQAAGMHVYRGNYRSALIGSLESTYERTARYVGEGPFRRGAINHAIANPPAGWTIDEAGEGFAETCAKIFADNPEVAELAWLEWEMLQVSTAPDVAPLTPEGFANATAGFSDEDWMELRLEFQPRASSRVVESNLTGLWTALEDGFEGDLPPVRLAQPRGCIVAREGERPTFQLVDPDAATAFAAMSQGETYGGVIALLAGEDPSAEEVQEAAMRAGGMLGEWLKDGLIVG